MYEVTINKQREYGFGFIPMSNYTVKLNKSQLRDWLRTRRNTSGFERNATVAEIISAEPGRPVRYGNVDNLHFIVTRQ